MGTSLCVFIIREYGKLQYLLCRGQWCWTLLEFGIFHFQTVFFFLLFFFFHFSPDYLSSCEHQFWNCFIRISVLRLKIKELIHTHSTSNFTFDPLFTRSENHSALLVKCEVCSWWSAPARCHRHAPTSWWSSAPWGVADWSQLHSQHSKMICSGLPLAWRWQKSSRWWRRRWERGRVVCTYSD